MDASSSAYQVMSYFLLDYELGRSTNLLKDKVIRDLYKDILYDIKPHLYKTLGESLYEIVEPHLTRKLMKKIYMPIVYGKTHFSAINDVEQALEYSISRSDASGWCSIQIQGSEISSYK